MSRRDRERLVVLSRVKDKQVKRRTAAKILGISLRQTHRLYKRYQAQGDVGLLHRGRGRVSNRRTATADRERALLLYREHYAGSEGYAGFGPTLLAEKLGKLHGLYVSHDTARRWMIGWGLLSSDMARSRRSRRRRLRKACFGEMVQMDGSDHDWFEGRGGPGPRCTLMVMVDDATGKKLVRFYAGESLAAAMDMLGRWCAKYGVPLSLYVDRAGIYRCDREPTVAELAGKTPPVTEFGRAMKELDVRLILAHSPQAKGRVERANGTLQDRLVKEMRLAKIATMEQANAWLESSSFLDDLNTRQAVEAADPTDAHRPLVLNLAEVLCKKGKRSVGNDGCVQFGGKVLQLESQKSHAQPGTVEVWSAAADNSVQAIRSGAVTWKWTGLASRPRKAAIPRPMSSQGPAHKPTEKMKRQMSNLFNRREPRPAERL